MGRGTQKSNQRKLCTAPQRGDTCSQHPVQITGCGGKKKTKQKRTEIKLYPKAIPLVTLGFCGNQTWTNLGGCAAESCKTEALQEQIATNMLHVHGPIQDSLTSLVLKPTRPLNAASTQNSGSDCSNPRVASTLNRRLFRRDASRIGLSGFGV